MPHYKLSCGNFSFSGPSFKLEWRLLLNYLVRDRKTMVECIVDPCTKWEKKVYIPSTMSANDAYNYLMESIGEN